MRGASCAVLAPAATASTCAAATGLTTVRETRAARLGAYKHHTCKIDIGFDVIEQQLVDVAATRLHCRESVSCFKRLLPRSPHHSTGICLDFLVAQLHCERAALAS